MEEVDGSGDGREAIESIESIFDLSNNIFVVNRVPTPSTIAKITSSGTLTDPWATLTGSHQASGCYTDPSGNVYASYSSASPTISKITSDGSITQSWVSSFGVSGVQQMVFDITGNAYAKNSSVISKIIPSGTVTTFASPTNTFNIMAIVNG